MSPPLGLMPFYLLFLLPKFQPCGLAFYMIRAALLQKPTGFFLLKTQLNFSHFKKIGFFYIARYFVI